MRFVSPALLALALVACSGGGKDDPTLGDDDDVVGDDDDTTGDDDDATGDDDDATGDDDDVTGDDDDDVTGDDDDDDVTGDDDDDDTSVVDADGDGSPEGLDCDDADAERYPGATELCDDVDRDCDGDPVNGLAFDTWYVDVDLDGFGDAADSVSTCDGAPAGYVADPTDCDDDDDGIRPDALELCDTVDWNCDGDPLGGLALTDHFRDQDQDGYGTVTDTVSTCDGAPAGYVVDGSDCDDGDPSVSPAASEICDAVDHDCDGDPSNGLAFTTWYRDSDFDQFGNPLDSVSTCDGPPMGYVADAGDCDDDRDDIRPGVAEQCDTVDWDCDGDPANGLAVQDWFADEDGDGAGTPYGMVSTCDGAPTGFVSAGDDCDDTNPAIFPGAVEQCDSIDHDCDGGAMTGDVFASVFTDLDLDGFGDANNPVACNVAPAGSVSDGGDCDDGNADVFPGAVEVCNGLDDDCDPATSEAGMMSFDDGLTVTDLSTTLGGATVASWVSPGPGRLDVCEGTWHARLSLRHDVDVVGHPGGSEAALEGDFTGTVVDMVGPQLRVNMYDVVVREGLGTMSFGPTRTGGGGAVACLGYDATLHMERVILEDSAAAYGGGLVAFECDVVMMDSTIIGNSADLSGGGAFLENATLDMTGSEVEDNNTGQYSGGGVYVTIGATSPHPASLDMREDSWIRGNVANNGGAVYMTNGTTASCDGMGLASGVIDNFAMQPASAAVHFGGGTHEWVSMGCDYQGNDPADVVGPFGQMFYGLGSTFTCTESGC